MTKTVRISAFVITFNEEQDIEKCLQSLSWCDELFVVDSGSVDRTREIAAKYAQVHIHAWEGFSPQKNFGASLATGDWVLQIDADEQVPGALRDEILATIQPDRSPCDGYHLPRINHWLGQPIRYGGWYPDYGLRLFKRGKATCVGDSHETFVVDGPVGRLQQPLLHFSYWSVRSHVERAVLRSAPLDARELLRNGGQLVWLPPKGLVKAIGRQLWSGPRTPLAFKQLYKTQVKNRLEFVWLLPFFPILRFVQRYIVRQGFRDGAAGFWIAVLSAVYDAVRCALVWEQYAVRAGKVTTRPHLTRIEPSYVAESKAAPNP